VKRASYIILVLVALLGATLAVACGDDEDSASTSPTATAAPTTAATKTATPAPFAAGSTMATIAASKHLTIGVKFDQPGFGVKDPVSGKVDGFDVAIGKEIAKALGLTEDQITFTEAISANRIPYLKEDKVDLVLATMTITDARKLEIDFSRTYFKAGQSLLVKKDNTTIKAVADLNGKKACSVTGSTSEKNAKEKAPQVELLSLDAYGACVASLKDGRVEAVTTDDIILAGFAKADPTLKLVGGTFTQEPYGIGFKKGKDDLVAFVNTLLNAMLKDGRWDAIYTKYLGGIEGLPSAADARAALPAN
jgi:glutamate transport system substrate-binding protein